MFKKRGVNKSNLRIECVLVDVKATSPQAPGQQFRLEYVRGPQKHVSKDYNFDSEGVLKFDEEPVQRVSGFLLTKKHEWLPKSCEFKLYAKKKGGKYTKMAEQKYNVSTHIGLSNQAPAELSLGKEFTLRFQLNILPACPVLHKALFEAQREAEEKAALNGSQMSERSSEYVAADETADTSMSEGVEDASISLKQTDVDIMNENRDLKELLENYELKLDNQEADREKLNKQFQLLLGLIDPKKEEKYEA